MGKMPRVWLITAFLMINLTCTEAWDDMKTCYILDGVLILYGIVLTILYCRLRVNSAKKSSASQSEKQPTEGGIYAGLTSQTTDTYETIRTTKKPIV